jgi:hypothetical protein
MVGHDLGGRPEAVYPKKNAKIPEVVKVNNYQIHEILIANSQIFIICQQSQLNLISAFEVLLCCLLPSWSVYS